MFENLIDLKEVLTLEEDGERDGVGAEEETEGLKFEASVRDNELMVILTLIALCVMLFIQMWDPLGSDARAAAGW